VAEQVPNPNEEPKTTPENPDGPGPPPEPPTTEQLLADLQRAKDEADRAKRERDKANSDAAQKRRRLEELERAEEERRTAQMGESDRLKKQADEAARKHRESEAEAEKLRAENVRLRIDHAVERYALDRGFRYPSNVPKLIDRDRVSVDPDTGKISGVKEAVDKLANDQPDSLVAAPRGGTPPAIPNNRRPGGGGTAPGGGGRPVPTVQEELLATGRYNV
jgi:hypothetical protein